jgi:hypothetical protein
VKRKITTLAMTILAGIVIVLGFAAPASAAYSDCPDGWFCAWSSVDASAVRYQYPFSAYGTNCVDLAADTRYSTDNNNWESFNNLLGSQYNVEVYTGGSCTGTHATIYNWWWYNQYGYYYWGNFNSTYKNTVSSFKFFN